MYEPLPNPAGAFWLPPYYIDSYHTPEIASVVPTAVTFARVAATYQHLVEMGLWSNLQER